MKYDPETYRTYDKVSKARKSISDILKELEDDPRVTDMDIDTFTDGVKKLYSEQMDAVNKRHGKKEEGVENLKCMGTKAVE